MDPNAPRLLSIAVTEAPHPLAQSELAERITEFFPRAEFSVEEHVSVFANAGIERRTLALPLERYIGGLPVAERNAEFLRVGGELLLDAAARAVPARLRSQITHVVTVSNSGVATPSLECAVMEQLGLAHDARRIPIFGLGCAGGVAGLQIAADLARSRPDALVLVLCCELTSLTHLANDQSLRNFVACALFGDGAAALLVAGSKTFDAEGQELARLGASASTLFDKTHQLMGWDVQSEGWAVVFSPRIPAVVRRETRAAVTRLVDPLAIKHFVLHPGGQKILDAYRQALALDEQALAVPVEVLAQHGNMSAVTVLFVLDRILRSPSFQPGPGLASAFGPGFSADLLTLDLLRGPGK